MQQCLIKIRSLVFKGKDFNESDFWDYSLIKKKNSWELIQQKKYTDSKDVSNVKFDGNYEKKIDLKNRKYLLKTNKYKGYCMCHSSYALRLYHKGKYIWEDLKNINCVFQIYTFDLDKDKSDEIFIFREGHGKMVLLIYEKQ